MLIGCRAASGSPRRRSRAGSTRSTTRSRAASRRACRGTTTGAVRASEAASPAATGPGRADRRGLRSHMNGGLGGPPALASDAAWLVGGAVRDRLLGRCDRGSATSSSRAIRPRRRARVAARGAGAARASRSRRSSAPGGWSRATPRWQVDVEPLRGGSIEADLALRDFTVNAIAEPIEGGGVDRSARRRWPICAARRLRMAGPRRVRRRSPARAAPGAPGGRARSRVRRGPSRRARAGPALERRIGRAGVHRAAPDPRRDARAGGASG